MIQFHPIERIRSISRRWYAAARGDQWFPHVPLSLLLALGGFWLLNVDVGGSWQKHIEALLQGDFRLAPGLLAPILIGGGMLTMAAGLLLRSRLAWVMSVLLVITGATSLMFNQRADDQLLSAYFALVLVALITAWRQFDRSSVAASTLFALTSIVMLLMYATFGAFYIGQDFEPPIADLITAFYYSVVTMSTVGYGDIIPQTTEAKLFSVSIIVFGVAIFATSLTSVIAPMVGRSLTKFVHRKGTRMKRENHFVVVGDGSLAINTARELLTRGHLVTRLVSELPTDDNNGDGDFVVGDPSDLDVLREAGAHQANTVLAMSFDDSENAFIVLAIKELKGGARTVAVVNDSNHMGRVKLVQPDVVIAPQVLGGELMAMLLSGEEISTDFIMQHVFMKNAAHKNTTD